MNSLFRIVALASVASTLSAVRAEPSDEELPLEILNLKKKPQQEEKYFHIIPLAKHVEGTAEVMFPGTSEWKPIQEGKHYPLGTAFRAGADSELKVAFGRDAIVTVSANSAFASKLQGLEVKSRTIRLMEGEIHLSLPRNMPDGKFFVSAPGFTVQTLAGESRYRYRTTGDGDEALVKCISDTMCVTGRHFVLPAMRATDEVRIRTSQDVLFTGLFGTAGDPIAVLDQGLVETRDFETNDVTISPKKLEWKLSPFTAVRLYRQVPKLGANMSVSVMTFTAEGQLKNRCTFTENRVALNTGEQGPTTKAEQAEIAKKAAEASKIAGEGDATAVETEVDESEIEQEDEPEQKRAPAAEEEDEELDF